MNYKIKIVLIIIILLIAYEVIKQSVFRYSKTCLPEMSSIEFDLPELYIDRLREYMKTRTKQNGVKVKGFRLKQHELVELYPNLVTLLFSKEFGNKVLEKLEFKPEKTLVFARIYEQGDKIDWHYDQNYTSGQRVTGILHVEVPEDNTSFFQFKEPCTKKIITPKTVKGTMLLYNGSEIFHRVTLQKNDSIRFVIIFAFYEKKHQTIINKIYSESFDLLSKFVSI